MDADVVKIFSFGSRSRIALPFVASTTRPAASGPRNRFPRSRHDSRRPAPGWIGSYSRSGGVVGAGAGAPQPPVPVSFTPRMVADRSQLSLRDHADHRHLPRAH